MTNGRLGPCRVNTYLSFPWIRHGNLWDMGYPKFLRRCHCPRHFSNTSWEAIIWTKHKTYLKNTVQGMIECPIPIRSMGLVYSPTFVVDFYGFHVGQYTNPMDSVCPIGLKPSKNHVWGLAADRSLPRAPPDHRLKQLNNNRRTVETDAFFFSDAKNTWVVEFMGYQFTAVRCFFCMVKINRKK